MKIFDLNNHVFYLKATNFFKQSRRKNWTREQILQRLDEIQEDVKRHLKEEYDKRIEWK